MADNGELQLQDPVPEEQIDVCAKDWIQEQIDKERVCVVILCKKLRAIVED